MDERIVYQGRVKTIEWAVRPNGTMPGYRDWVKLEKKQRAALLVTIRRLGDEGTVQKKEKFAFERDGFFAIKAWKVRVYCFMTSDRRVVLTNVASKKQDKAKKTDLERAKHIRSTCINA